MIGSDDGQWVVYGPSGPVPMTEWRQRREDGEAMKESHYTELANADATAKTLPERLRALSMVELRAFATTRLVADSDEAKQFAVRAIAFDQAAQIAEGFAAAEAAQVRGMVPSEEYREMRERAYAAEYARDHAYDERDAACDALQSASMNCETAECHRVSAEQTLALVRGERDALEGTAAGLTAEVATTRVAFSRAVVERDGARKERDEAVATAERLQRDAAEARSVAADLGHGYGAAAERERLAAVFDALEAKVREESEEHRREGSHALLNTTIVLTWAYGSAAAECRKVPSGAGGGQ